MVDIAQLVSASGCGPEGRRFESDYPPQKKARESVLFSTKCSAPAEREASFGREVRFAREVCLRHDMRNT